MGFLHSLVSKGNVRVMETTADLAKKSSLEVAAKQKFVQLFQAKREGDVMLINIPTEEQIIQDKYHNKQTNKIHHTQLPILRGST